MIIFYKRTGGVGDDFDPRTEYSRCVQSTIGFWSKVQHVYRANRKRQAPTYKISFDVWQVVPVTLDNVTMYANTGEPQIFMRSDVYPLKRCRFEGRDYWCPQRTRLLLNHLYQPSIAPHWTCASVQGDAAADYAAQCTPIQHQASSTYIPDFTDLGPDKKYPDIPLMYYSRTEQRMQFHLPTHYQERAAEILTHSPRGISVGLASHEVFETGARTESDESAPSVDESATLTEREESTHESNDESNDESPRRD